MKKFLTRNGDRVVRLRDVGRAELGALNERTVLRRDGIITVGLVLRPQSGANEIAIADEFYRRLAIIERDLPAGVDVAVGFDNTGFIRASIKEVIQTLFIALLLVCATIFTFLREWRTTITIPIGLVVDDAIVVVENIYKRIEQGQTPAMAGAGFKVRDVIPRFIELAQQHPAFSFVDVNLKFNQPELVLDIDRDRTDLSRLSVRATDGALVPLQNLVTVREQSSAPVLYRCNRFTAATFSANLADGVTLGTGIEAMREIAAAVLDDSYSTELAGQSREFDDTGSSLLFVFVLALLLIYLVLATQFESFRDPLAIMLTVPMAITGGLISLWYFGQTLNIFFQIGLIVLIGLVTKNGILIVEFANQRREASLSIADAVEEAAAARFRPILMTTLSTVLGTLPLAMALGAGSQSRVPLGLAVIGGMLPGSFLSLYVVPAAYRLFASRNVRGQIGITADTARAPGQPGV